MKIIQWFWKIWDIWYMELLYELNQCNLNLPVVSHYLHDFPPYKWDRNTMDFQVFRFETTQHSSFSLWGWRSPILDQRSLGSLGHIAIYSLYPHVYPKYKKKNIDVEKSTMFSCHDLPGFPMAKIHTCGSRGANAWRSLVGGLWGLLQRRQDGAGLATRTSEIRRDADWGDFIGDWSIGWQISWGFPGFHWGFWWDDWDEILYQTVGF